MSLGDLSKEENRESNVPVIVGKRKIWPVFLKIFIVILLFALIFFYLNREFKLDKVNINGCDYYTEEEIRERIISGPLKGNALGIYIKNKIREQSMPFVEKIDVDMVNNHELLISVYEKSMIACIPYMNEYLYFDKDGIIVENSQKKMDYVPVIEGIQFDSMNLYEKLSVDDDDVFETIVNLSQLIKQYKIKTDYVYFNYQSEVTIYTDDIKVLLGKSSRYDEKISEISNILKKAKKRKLKGTLDMRNFVSGQSEIIFKEE